MRTSSISVNVRVSHGRSALASSMVYLRDATMQYLPTNNELETLEANCIPARLRDTLESGILPLNTINEYPEGTTKAVDKFQAGLRVTRWRR